MTSKLISDNTGVIATCPNCEHKFNIYAHTTEKTIRTGGDVFDAFMYLSGLDQEELHVALLNSKNKIIKRVMIYKGNVSASLVRVSEVVRQAIVENAAGMILVHNHPSGDPTPSPDDLHLTAEVLAACRLMDIDFLDHVIISGDTYASLRERGISFDRSNLIKPRDFVGAG